MDSPVLVALHLGCIRQALSLALPVALINLLPAGIIS